jgi:hypothetical protein
VCWLIDYSQVECSLCVFFLLQMRLWPKQGLGPLLLLTVTLVAAGKIFSDGSKYGVWTGVFLYGVLFPYKDTLLVVIVELGNAFCNQTKAS